MKESCHLIFFFLKTTVDPFEMRCITFPTYIHNKILNKKGTRIKFTSKKRSDLTFFFAIHGNLSNAVTWSQSAYLLFLLTPATKWCSETVDWLFIIWLESLREFRPNDAAGKNEREKSRSTRFNFVAVRCQLLWNSALIMPTQGKRTIWSAVNWRWKNSNGPRCQGNSKCKWDEEDAAHRFLSLSR